MLTFAAVGVMALFLGIILFGISYFLDEFFFLGVDWLYVISFLMIILSFFELTIVGLTLWIKLIISLFK